VVTQALKWASEVGFVGCRSKLRGNGLECRNMTGSGETTRDDMWLTDGLSGRGRESEFMALLEPIQESISRYVYRSAWNAADAHDIAQHAITVAWREFDRFEKGTNFRAWMFRISINAVYRFNKRYKRERSVVDVDRLDLADDSIEREEAWQSILEQPERVMESLDDRLVSALGTLTVDARQCLLLRLLEGFSYKEIAEMVGLPLGTVMSHVHRARMKLREQLAELAIESGFVKGNKI
jgi:RNA polymerase sigma-70 factor, ECF subfamily